MAHLETNRGPPGNKLAAVLQAVVDLLMVDFENVDLLTLDFGKFRLVIDSSTS